MPITCILNGGAIQLDTLTSLFNKICDYLNATSWFSLIQWPMWTLLVILALCGVYTARFGKGKLLTMGFQGALKLTLIYMVAAGFYAYKPDFMSNFSQLPLLYVSDTAVTLVNPLELLDRWNTALPAVMVRLYFLLFFINIAGVFEYSPVNILTWAFFQGFSAAVSVFVYAMISFGVRHFWPGPLSVLHCLLAVLLLMMFALLFAFKLYYTFIKKGSNPNFDAFFKAMTEKKYGSPFTVSAFSFLIVIGYTILANLCGHAQFQTDSYNWIAYFLVGLMCTGTLYCFSRYFNNK